MTNQQHEKAKKGSPSSGNQPEFDQEFLSLLKDPYLESEFALLGFDTTDDRIDYAGTVGPFAVMTYVEDFEQSGEYYSSIEYHFLIGHSDRNGEINYNGQDTNTGHCILAIHVTGFLDIRSAKTELRFIFEKAYSIGQGAFPRKANIASDLLKAQRSYLRQLLNIRQFLQATKAVSS